MYIQNAITSEKSEVVIVPMTNLDFKALQKNRNLFNKFSWDDYRGNEVYKLTLKNDDQILGLMCLLDHKDDTVNAIEIKLLEVSEENIGSKRKFENIGGCLIAFACRESFKRGHDGVVFLIPKTQLIDHYSSKCGFLHVGLKTIHRPEGFMTVYGDDSRKLINKYLE